MEAPPTSDQLMLFAAASHSYAKTYHLPEKAQELKALARDYGASTPELLAKYDPDTSSWRTSQLCLDGALSVFSEIWPRSGLMRSGIAYQLPPLVRLTDETGFGLLPTARSRDWKTAESAQTLAARGKSPQNSLPDAILNRVWPTPDASPHKYRLCGNSQQSNSLNGIHGGQLNPTWVEWLMGFPLGWTVCEAWATRSYHKSRKSSEGQ